MGNMHGKFGEDWLHGFGNILTERQKVKQTNKQTDILITIFRSPIGGRIITRIIIITIMRMRHTIESRLLITTSPLMSVNKYYHVICHLLSTNNKHTNRLKGDLSRKNMKQNTYT